MLIVLTSFYSHTSVLGETRSGPERAPIAPGEGCSCSSPPRSTSVWISAAKSRPIATSSSPPSPLSVKGVFSPTTLFSPSQRSGRGTRRGAVLGGRQVPLRGSRRSRNLDLADAACCRALGHVVGAARSASASVSASTVHQIACPPERHEARVGRWRSGLSCPLNEAKTAPHSRGSWRCWSRYRDTSRACRGTAAATSGATLSMHPDLRPQSWIDAGPTVRLLAELVRWRVASSWLRALREVGALDCPREATRDETSSLRKMLRRCVSTVFLPRNSSAAICGLVLPSTARRTTCSSRSVSDSRPVPSLLPGRVRRWARRPSFPSSRSASSVAQRAAGVEPCSRSLELGHGEVALACFDQGTACEHA